MSDENSEASIAPGPEAEASAEDVADRPETGASADGAKPDLLTHVAEVTNDCFEDDPGRQRGSVE